MTDTETALRQTSPFLCGDKELGAYLGIKCRDTLARLRSEGLPQLRVIGRQIMYEKKAVDAFIRKRGKTQDVRDI